VELVSCLAFFFFLSRFEEHNAVRARCDGGRAGASHSMSNEEEGADSLSPPSCAGWELKDIE
jgi:hypothetical protein